MKYILPVFVIICTVLVAVGLAILLLNSWPALSPAGRAVFIVSGLTVIIWSICSALIYALEI